MPLSAKDMPEFIQLIRRATTEPSLVEMLFWDLTAKDPTVALSLYRELSHDGSIVSTPSMVVYLPERFLDALNLPTRMHITREEYKALEDQQENKIACIKALRNCTGLSLKAAKDIIQFWFP